MPEELVVILVVLGVVIWIIASVVSSISEAFASNRTARLERKRVRLGQHVRVVIPDQLGVAERDLKRLEEDFKKHCDASIWSPKVPQWERKTFPSQPDSANFTTVSTLDIQDIYWTLHPNETSWTETERAILTMDCRYPIGPPIYEKPLDFRDFSVPDYSLLAATMEIDQSVVSKEDFQRYFGDTNARVERYNKSCAELAARYADLSERIRSWKKEDALRWTGYVQESESIALEESSAYQAHAKGFAACEAQKQKVRAALRGFETKNREHVINRVQYILCSLGMPGSVPRSWEIDFDEVQHILIVEMALPNVVHLPPVKTVSLKRGTSKKPLNQSERKEYLPKVHPAVLLRIAFELFRNDASETIGLLVLNGWVDFNDPATGTQKRAYTASLMVERHQIVSLALANVDPLAAFQNLKGKSAGKLVEIIPINPTITLNREDSRFVDSKTVLNTLNNATNLAAMDWQDFEHLIRELFEHEFSGKGAEVKITQASRDRGVDAVVFNPDPIHGGKYIIQAKRYTNTVDVSAVRDLCAVVRKEGASRGILVTTSTYGSDAYAFANNEPVTLLNGAELLGLLEKHGYKFRINLDEARQLKVAPHSNLVQSKRFGSG